MITVIIILFRLCSMSLVHHKAIIRDNRMCSYWSLWIYGVTSNHSIAEIKGKGVTCNHTLVATSANSHKGGRFNRTPCKKSIIFLGGWVRLKRPHKKRKATHNNACRWQYIISVIYDYSVVCVVSAIGKSRVILLVAFSFLASTTFA